MSSQPCTRVNRRIYFVNCCRTPRLESQFWELQQNLQDENDTTPTLTKHKTRQAEDNEENNIDRVDLMQQTVE